MRHVLLTLAVCSAFAAVPSRAESPAEPAVVANAGSTELLPAFSWGRLQGRMAFASQATPLRSSAPGLDTAFKVTSLSLMGDYYLRPSLSQLTLGGWRATSGLLVGQRTPLWGFASHGLLNVPGVDGRLGHDFTNEPSTPAPYLGFGYSGSGGTLGKAGSWGFSADLGLMSLSPGSAGRFGKVLSGSQSLDDLVHDMRLSPVIQFGFSYAF